MYYAAPSWTLIFLIKFKALENPEWWLVVAGLFTFVIVAWQAIETRRAVQATREGTEVLIKAQQPYIAASAHGNPTQTLADRIAPRVEINLFNRGLTAAYDFFYESWIELLPPPFADFTAGADYFNSPDPMVLYPNHAPVILNIPITSGVTEKQLENLGKLRLQACVRIRGRYRDAFNPSREVNFGFCILPDGLGFLDKYNNAR